MIISLEDVSKSFPLRSRGGLGSPTLLAVNGVSFSIAKGETFALVGESGCGKSTTARMVLGLENPSRGRVRFGTAGRDSSAGESSTTPAKRRAVFQNPWSSLNPRRRIGSLMRESLGSPRGTKEGLDARRHIVETLIRVGLNEEIYDSFPHQLSGGQRQRAAIAIAIVADPDLVVLDEPISALDVSIRGQILNLLMDIQSERGCAYLLISHDLLATRAIADRVAVMYLGSIVEIGPASEVFERPQHPYTRSLLDAEPCHHPSQRAGRRLLEGDVPSAMDRPSGCAFHPRCPRADDSECVSTHPVLVPASTRSGSSSACYHPLTSPHEVAKSGSQER